MIIKVLRSIRIASVVLLGFVVTILLFSCTSNIKYMKINELTVRDDIIGNEIIRCLNEKDKYGLNNLFCDKVKDTDYLNNQIDFLFDYVDKSGGIMFDGTGKWKSAGGHSSRQGGRRVVDLKGREYDKEIILDYDKEYELSYTMYKVLTGHREYEGVIQIRFVSKINESDIDLVNRINDAINKAKKNEKRYLGIGIYNLNYETYLRYNIVPKEIYENEEYRFSFDELEKNKDRW